MIIAAPGSRSEGFKMRVLPVTVAKGIVHKGIILEHRDQRRGEKRKYVGRTRGN